MMTKRKSYLPVLNEEKLLFMCNTAMHKGCIQSTKKFINLYNRSNLFKKYHAHILQNFQHMVGSSLSSFFKRRLGLENPIEHGKYCIVIRSTSESKCALSTALTSYSIIAPCYGRVGAEYNSCLTVNNARRFVLYGFLTTRSPNLTTAVV